MKNAILILTLSIMSNFLLGQVDNRNTSNNSFEQLSRNDSIELLIMLRNANFLPDSVVPSVDSFLILTMGKDSFEKSISNTKVRVWVYDMNGEVIGGSLYNNGKAKKPKK